MPTDPERDFEAMFRLYAPTKGYTIVGGLALSQLLTLYTTPVVYLYLDRLSQFLGQRPTVPQNAGSSMSYGESSPSRAW